MVLDKDTALRTAELLLQINAIKLKPENPFTWASGWKSPIYCDNRILLSYPPIRNYVREQMARQVEVLYGKPDVIAGASLTAVAIIKKPSTARKPKMAPDSGNRLQVSRACSQYALS